jgi:hypothetical protein
MNKRKYIPPRSIDIDPQAVQDPKLLKDILDLQQQAQENRESGKGREYLIEIDSSIMNDPNGLEAIQSLQRSEQKVGEDHEPTKGSRLFLKLIRTLPRHK